MPKITKLSICTALFLNITYAKEEITLQPLIVVSTSTKSNELFAVEAVEVYTQSDIEKSHVQNIYEFLNKNSSLTALPSYGNPFTQKLDLRGFGYENGYQNIVVKVNNRRLNNIDMVPQLLSSISPNQIERIEIIKSSNIIDGGDGAVAGVVNIITKKSDEIEVSTYIGTYGTFDGNFYIGHTNDLISLNIAGEAKKSGGIRYIDDDGNKDSSKFTNFSFELAYNPIKDIQLRLNGLTSNIDVWYAGSLTKNEYENDPFQKGNLNWGATRQLYSSDVIGGGLSYFFNDELSLNSNFSHEYKTSEYVTYATKSNYIYNSFDIDLSYSNQNWKFKTGIDGFYGDRKNTSNTTTKDNLSFYILSEYKYFKHTLKAGYKDEKVNYKHIPNSGEELLQKSSLNGVEVGYNYAIDDKMSLFANYTKSYQAPDIDRFFRFDGTFNDFIDPMKANSYTVGYNYITKLNKLKLSFYYIDLNNEIYYYNDPNYINSKNTNIDKSHKYGFDFYDNYIFSEELNGVLSYNYVVAKIDEEIESGKDYSEKVLPGVSNHNIKLTLNYLPNKNTTFSLTQIYKSEAYAANDFANNFEQKQDAYSSTNFSLTYKEKSWSAFLKIENIFNQKNGIWIKDDAIYPVNFTTTAYAGVNLRY